MKKIEKRNMQVQIGETVVEAWRVDAADTQLEEWVQNLFDKQICFWHPKNPDQLRFNMMFGGMASTGDYLIYMGKSDIKVISEKKFKKEYRVL
ncbi:hypothetical protein [Lactococcus allomyrinae]|nr:hypothetical protein [Lactococcus allomyrinae]